MKVLKSHEFASNGSQSSYDWDAILDGQIRQLTRGVDFDSKVQTVCALARKYAKQRGLRVRIDRDMETESVILQAIHEEEEQEEPIKISRRRRRA